MSPEHIKYWERWNARAREEKRAGLWPEVKPEFRAVLYGDGTKDAAPQARGEGAA